MISITQNLETPAFSALVDPNCADLLRQAGLPPPSALEAKLTWQTANSRGAVKDRLLKDENIRLVLIAADTETDPLLRDLARNIDHIRGRAWIHVVLAVRDRVAPPLLAQLRNFASWSVLALPCTSGDLTEILHEAAAGAEDRHRLAMLSTAIRADRPGCRSGCRTWSVSSGRVSWARRSPPRWRSRASRWCWSTATPRRRRAAARRRWRVSPSASGPVAWRERPPRRRCGA